MQTLMHREVLISARTITKEPIACSVGRIPIRQVPGDYLDPIQIRRALLELVGYLGRRRRITRPGHLGVYLVIKTMQEPAFLIIKTPIQTLAGSSGTIIRTPTQAAYFQTPQTPTHPPLGSSETREIQMYNGQITI